MLSRIHFLFQRIFRRHKLDCDLREEIGVYFDEVENRYRQQGYSSQDSCRLAHVQLGHPESIRQRVRNELFGDWLELLMKDLRYSLRLLRRSPLFVLVAVCSLAIGIGANTAMFSFTDWWILRPLPVRNPSQIAVIRAQQAGVGGGPATLSYPDYTSLHDLNHSFDGVVAEAYASFGVAHASSTIPERRIGMYVSANFFSVLGIQPAYGRFFTQEEDAPGYADRVLVVSHEFWASALHGEDAIGKTIRIDGTPFTIIGVAPRNFPGIDMFMRPSFYLPIVDAELSQEVGALRDRNNRWLTLRARLKPGVGISAAQADIAAIAEALRKGFPDTDSALQLRVESELQFQAEYSAPTTAFVVMLTLLAFCVLLVACANVAGLLLSRSASYSRQVAMKLAIGVTRWAVVRQSLIENLLIAITGGAVGLAVAWAGVRLLRSLPPPSPDLPFAMDIRLDLRALLFAAAVSIACTFLFGLGPALGVTRTDLLTAIKPHIGQGVKGGGWGLRTVLIWGQVALSVTLLIASAILISGFRSELMKGPGFRTSALFLVGLDPTLIRYSPARTASFYDKLLQRMRLAPGAGEAALASTVPLAFGATQTGVIPEGNAIRPGEAPPQVISSIVSEDYFNVMGIPLNAGRAFSDSDTANSPPVVIVNQHLAEHDWPGQNPLGKTLRLGDIKGPLVRVVGVSATTKYVFIAEPPLDAIYLPLRQHPTPQMILISQNTSSHSEKIERVVQQVVSSIDSSMPLFDEQPVNDLYLNRAVRTPQVITRATAAFGIMGLILSLVGLYGLVNYQVLQRTREIGVRMALGAAPRAVVAMIVRHALSNVLVGAVTGLLLGALASKAIRSGLFVDIGRVQLLPFAWVIGAVLLTAGISALAPAIRAASIDPVLALRDE